jgi:hypothetical protein
MKTKITFTREYEGGYGIRADGQIIGYIDRALDGNGWFVEGQRHRYLSEAKASIETIAAQF